MRKSVPFALAAFVALLLGSCAGARPGPRDPSFPAFLDRMDAAQLHLQNGMSAPYKELWSEADDVTLIGGFGGGIEKGWPAVSGRLDWAAAQFSRGRNSIERVQLQASGALGYVVQRERIWFVAPGEERESEREYRVTIVCRREGDAWRIVHRHADVQTTRQPARR